MSNQVVYVSRSGNTRKIAEAIAQCAGVAAQVVCPDTTVENVSILFVGGALYAGHIAPALKAFLEKLDKAQVQKVAVFSTTFNPNATAFGEIQAILAQKGIEVLQDHFHTRGKFLLFSRKRPDEDDLANAKRFAQRILAQG